MREIMSEGSNRTPAARKKRVKILKKLILLILLILITVPCVCCAVLFVKLRHLNRDLQQLTAKLDGMSRRMEEQAFAGNDAAVQNLQKDMTLPVYGASPDTGGDEAKGSETVGIEIADSEAADDESAGRKVYLTFDDGPSRYTEEILDILDEYEIRATFFVVGKEDDNAKEALRQIVERGHSLGMHSYSHKYGELYESLDSFAEDFVKLQDYLFDVTGVKSTLYRFPGGSSNTVSKTDMKELAAYLEEQGVTFFDWNVAAGDGGRKLLSVQELVDNSTGDIEKWDTAVLLMHDSADKRTTVEALPTIIENILALDDTVILPITGETEPVQHIHNVSTKVKE